MGHRAKPAVRQGRKATELMQSAGLPHTTFDGNPVFSGLVISSRINLADHKKVVVISHGHTGIITNRSVGLIADRL